MGSDLRKRFGFAGEVENQPMKIYSVAGQPSGLSKEENFRIRTFPIGSLALAVRSSSVVCRVDVPRSSGLRTQSIAVLISSVGRDFAGLQNASPGALGPLLRFGPGHVPWTPQQPCRGPFSRQGTVVCRDSEESLPRSTRLCRSPLTSSVDPLSGFSEPAQLARGHEGVGPGGPSWPGVCGFKTARASEHSRNTGLARRRRSCFRRDKRGYRAWRNCPASPQPGAAISLATSGLATQSVTDRPLLPMKPSGTGEPEQPRARPAGEGRGVIKAPDFFGIGTAPTPAGTPGRRGCRRTAAPPLTP
jgi:hypothetical protein